MKRFDSLITIAAGVILFICLVLNLISDTLVSDINLLKAYAGFMMCLLIDIRFDQKKSL